MLTSMTKEPIPIIITLKLKSGEDIIGVYGGDVPPKDETEEKTVAVYQPIKIRQISTNIFGRVIYSYVSDFYSLFGATIVFIPYSNIMLKSVASDFFKVYYGQQLPLLSHEEDNIRESHLNFFRKEDIKEILRNSKTDSLYVEPETNYVQ